jgi:4-hydroxy-2-oxoglutarate aldolase
MLLEGVFPATTTPFYPDGDLYLRKLEHNVARYSRTQLAGMVVLGSTGEAVMLSPEEQREVLSIAISAAAADKVMIAGVGQESVRQTIAMAEHAATLNYDAILVRTPFFYRNQLHPEGRSQTEMLTYYRAVADQSPLPVVLYSVPAFTRYDLPIDIVAELAQHPNIIGIKDSSGKPERIAALVEATKSFKRTVTVTPTFAAVTGRMVQSQPEASSPRFVAAEALGRGNTALAVAAPPAGIKTRKKEISFSVLTGGASTLQAALEAGASGTVLAFAACAPQCCYEIWTAWREGDFGLAEEKQERIRQASIRVAAQMGVPGLKFACDLNGYYGGRPRLPLLPLTADQQQEVQSLMLDIRY